jgi:hypothetical protein
MFENNLNLTMKIQYWFIMHRVRLRRLGVLLLMIFDILIVLLGVTGWIMYFGSQAEFNKMLSKMGNQPLIFKQDKPRPLVIKEISALSEGADKYDLIALVKNVNTQWYIKNINYQFVVDGETVDSGSTFVLAGQEKVISKFGISLSQQPISVALTFEENDVTWSRAKTDIEMGAILPNFAIDNVVWMPIVDQKLAPFSRLTAQITNKSVYNFWSVGFYALVLDAGGSIVGASYTTWDNAFEGEQHQLIISWDGVINRGRDVKIYPDVDVTDPSLRKQ